MDIYSILRFGLNFFELLACVTGFIVWAKIRHTHWKWFPVYLAIIVLVEGTGKYIFYVIEDPALNVNVYRYFGLPVQFLFFCWLFRQYLKNYKEKNWPLFGAIIYIICWIGDFLYFNKQVFVFQSFSYTSGNIVLLVLIILFFVKFMNSDEILKYRSSMMFWTCIGLLVFYLGSLPFYGLWNTLRSNYFDIFNTYWIIQISLNYLMYLCFTIAFIWGKPK